MPDNRDDRNDRDEPRRRGRDDDEDRDEPRQRRRRDDDEDLDDRFERRRGRLDDDDDDFDRSSPFPALAYVTGCMWIGVGALILFGVLASFAGVGQPRNQAMANQNPGEATGRVCGTIFIGIFGAAFIRAGIQSIAGTAKGMLGNGIGSIVLSLLFLVAAVVSIGAGNLAAVVGCFIFGFGLLMPGVFACIADGPYKEWRKSNKKRRRSSKRYFESRDDD